MKPELSVIIPTYTRRESLQRLLTALLKQEQVIPEIIVVDQNQPGYLDGWLPPAGNIRQVFLSTPNASDARNKGFLEAQGKYLLFIDDDLVPEADFCRKGLEIFHTYPAISCFCPLVYNAEGKEVTLSQNANKKVHPLEANPAIYTITETISAAIFFERTYFERTGGFDPLIFSYARAVEDQEFFTRMTLRRLELYFVPTVEVYHDETVTGGCEMRTQSYWVTREKCMKGWCYRFRMHHNPPGVLSIGALIRMSRSAFLNREVLRSGLRDIGRQIGMLNRSIRGSGRFLKTYLAEYRSVTEVDHIKALSKKLGAQ